MSVEMEELKKTRRITIAGVIAVMVLIIGYLIYDKPMNYKLSAEDMAYELMLVYHVTPEEAMELMWDSTKVFIDIRNPYEYQADHLENAYNIPVEDLLNPEILILFDQWKDDSTQVILYANSELEATSPWMVLYQLGYSNTQIMMGGMGYINKLYNEELAENETFNVEAPLYDYSGIIEAAKSADPTQFQAEPQKKVFVRKKKKKAAEGGC